MEGLLKHILLASFPCSRSFWLRRPAVKPGVRICIKFTGNAILHADLTPVQQHTTVWVYFLSQFIDEETAASIQQADPGIVTSIPGYTIQIKVVFRKQIFLEIVPRCPVNHLQLTRTWVKCISVQRHRHPRMWWTDLSYWCFSLRIALVSMLRSLLYCQFFSHFNNLKSQLFLILKI